MATSRSDPPLLPPLPTAPPLLQVYDAVKAELMLRGAYFLKDEEEKDRVGSPAWPLLGCLLLLAER